MPNTLNSEILLGTSLQQVNDGSEHVLLSIGDVIQERVFFHPALISEDSPLSDADTMALEAVVNGQDLREFYLEVLNETAKDLKLNEHKRVRVQLSNCDSSSLSALIAGSLEEKELNPMLGMRGVSRYASGFYKASFAVECQFIKDLREQGIDVEIVVPFVRSLSDAAKVIDNLAEQGLPRGLNGLKVLFGADTPSSVLLSERLLKYFDGVCIDLASLTQLTLGLDRNNEAVSSGYNVEHESVIELLSLVLTQANAARKPAILITEDLVTKGKLQEFLVEHPKCDVINLD
ncbi:phosphoenolpyruvate synthase [Vibrio inusitatus NBRC 102082]|uniref:Phosphoenolpyruvate synthase n=1 Tax=Vibrio inusitatus NBRC 102082 TaxID=1219070 RepID=A0A4Y3HUM9_9VIBR|nr:putative PEP-binding protein [Vibrio inusitatus]GEA50849.1 phosphoenolpyruvate synthase [Vibrio inusitatus NBRC 102082]